MNTRPKELCGGRGDNDLNVLNLRSAHLRRYHRQPSRRYLSRLGNCVLIMAVFKLDIAVLLGMSRPWAFLFEPYTVTSSAAALRYSVRFIGCNNSRRLPKGSLI
jgi:hypothetical protein